MFRACGGTRLCWRLVSCPSSADPLGSTSDDMTAPAGLQFDLVMAIHVLYQPPAVRQVSLGCGKHSPLGEKDGMLCGAAASTTTASPTMLFLSSQRSGFWTPCWALGGREGSCW